MHKLKDKLEGFIFTAPGAITSLILLGSFIDAIRRAWNAYEFFPSFLLWWVAGALYLPIILSPFAAAYFVGKYVARRSDRDWLGWLVGFIAVFLFTGAVLTIVGSIPGVGWRFNVFLGSSGIGDYDY